MDDVFAPTAGSARAFRRLLACALAAAATGACDEARSGSAEVEVRDSAGIAIVRSDGPGWVAPDAWRVTRAPTLRIGAADGDSTQLLYRVVGAVRLSDGRLVIGNAGTHEVRFYAPDGAWLRSVGRRGGGPGEFSELDWVGPGGDDSVATFDYRERRVSIFGPDGAFVRSFRLEEPSGDRFFWPMFLGRLEDGRFLVAGQPTYFTGPTFEGVPDDSVLYLLYDAEGRLLGRPLTLPATQRWVHSDERSVTNLEMPFGRRAHAAVAGAHLYAGTSDAWQIAVHAPDGSLVRLVRRRWTPQAVTPMDAARYRQAEIAAAADYPEWQERLRGHLQRVPFGDTLPAFASFFVGDLGFLWVEEYRRPGALGGPRYVVFDPEGRLLGAVVMPEGLRLRQIGEDFILGTRTDELGVEYVELYGLTRMPG